MSCWKISVLQPVQAFEEVNNIKVPYEIVCRRVRNLTTCYANASKAEKKLEAKAKRCIKEMYRDAWRFENNTIE